MPLQLQRIWPSRRFEADKTFYLDLFKRFMC